MNAAAWRKWAVRGGIGVLCMFVGAVAFAILPLLSDRGQAPALPDAEAKLSPPSGRAGPNLKGDLQALLSDFSVTDAEGHAVLRVNKLSTFLDIDALRRKLVRIPRGTASDIQILVRRGPSGNVTLGEALRGGPRKEAEGQNSGSQLQIGPIAVSDAKLVIDLGGAPVIFHVDVATLRVRRKIGEQAPKVFLSGIHGVMSSPDPLRRPITIHGAEGVVDLAGGPLVDLRMRVCIGNAEMKIRVEVPERHTQTQLTLDADGPMAQLASIALAVVARQKPSKLHVLRGKVSVDESYRCGDDRKAGPTTAARGAP